MNAEWIVVSSEGIQFQYAKQASLRPGLSKFFSGCLCAKLLQSCPTFCDTMDYSLPGSSVHGILRQEYWSGLPCPSLGDLPDPGIEPASRMFPALAGGFSTTSAAWEAREVHNCWEPSCGLNQDIIPASWSGWSLTVTIQGKDGWTMILLVKHSSFLGTS